MKSINKLFSMAVAALCISNVGAITTFSGQVEDGGSASGKNLDAGATENALAQLFTEKQGVSLTSNLTIDGAPPDFDSSGSIASGTRVNSYLFHLDKLGITPLTPFVGTITFDQPILGIIFTRATLELSDGILGLAGSYYNHSTRGLESGQDAAIIDGGTLKFNFDFAVAEGVDNVRILTAVPDAGSTFGLLAVGATLLGLRFRKR